MIIDLDLNNAEEVIAHMEEKHDLDSDPEWSVALLREVGGPADADLHFWYHTAPRRNDHSHGYPFSSYKRNWSL